MSGRRVPAERSRSPFRNRVCPRLLDQAATGQVPNGDLIDPHLQGMCARATLGPPLTDGGVEIGRRSWRSMDGDRRAQAATEAVTMSPRSAPRRPRAIRTVPALRAPACLRLPPRRRVPNLPTQRQSRSRPDRDRRCGRGEIERRRGDIVSLPLPAPYSVWLSYTVRWRKA
jgi:hypothetical protein